LVGGPEKAGVGVSIPSLATITDTHSLPIVVTIEKLNISRNFEYRAFGSALGRKHQALDIVAERLPGNFDVSMKQSTDLGGSIVEELPEILPYVPLLFSTTEVMSQPAPDAVEELR
jgi:hypothetical protein